MEKTMVKRVLGLLVVLSLGFLVQGSFAAEKIGLELVKNGGFEEWGEDTGGGKWVAKNFSVCDVTHKELILKRAGEGEIDTERHSGKYSQYIFAESWSQGIYQEIHSIENGKTYRATLWVKVMKGDFRFRAGLKQGAIQLADRRIKKGGNQGEWRKYVLEITIPESSEKCGPLSIFLLSLRYGSSYVDDLSVREVIEEDASSIEI